MLLNRKTFVASVAVTAGLVLAAAASAQTGTQAPPPTAPSARSQAQTPPSGLNLTDAQRDQIRTLREAQRKDAQALREKMRAARLQLRQAMRADVPDEAAVRSAAEALAALQADQAVQQARSRSQYMKVLTPEQQARMKQARARAAERAQRAQRAMRARRGAQAERQMMQRQRMMRQQYLRWWRGWI
jgi:Spy/CpxP family protein refolding chaperone